MSDSDSVFKGAVQGGTISAVLLADFSNQDSDLLVAAYAPLSGGPSRVDQNATVPGGKAEVSLEATENGVLEVWVAIGAEADSGRLQVFRDGELRDDEAIVGSVRWIYSVEGV